MFEIDKSDSNPFTYATKERTFVYQGKRRFFLLLGRKLGKIQQNRASERSRGFSGARFFCFQGENTGVQIAFLCACKEKQKGSGREDLNHILLEVCRSVLKELDKDRQPESMMNFGVMKSLLHHVKSEKTLKTGENRV